ncbi:DUF4097 family beta strand repeat-containing protein [Brevibacterium aurantiacum]|uniref:DUF4097 domain-containing protein n=1 Tax=Brevibacterium aurantiacum TaxID=273384 RepID=A0A556C1D8_BREAU|nr:DUF4097 family beta strand repeat-containing protein [Brevibacterium aurantiacum]TSI11274.1 DUF4097 domain-containing protein [Brevibacterium aurantiacum]
MTRRPAILLAVTLAALTLPACGSVDNADPETASFAVAGDHLTIIKESSGNIELYPDDVDEVEVTRWFSGHPGEASWDFAGDELTLATDCGFLSSCDVRYQVAVPQNLAVNLDASNGDVTAADFETALSIRTENGAIAVSDISGELSLNSTSGDQRATDLRSRDVHAQAENGKIELSFKDVPSDVAVTTDNGAIALQVPDQPYAVVSTTDNGAVNNTLNTDKNSPHRIDVTTENGNIELLTD